MTDGSSAHDAPAEPTPADLALADPAADGWDAFVAGHPLATYLQTSAWARVKAPNGWTTRLIDAPLSEAGRIGARILFQRPRPMPWTFAYAPRGPLSTDWSETALQTWGDALRVTLGEGRGRWPGVAHVRIDPEIELDGPLDDAGATRTALARLGWRAAPEVQPSVTRVVDLTAGEAALWSDLRSKWRQYVNRARAAGVTVADVDADADPTAFPTFQRIMTETSRRTSTPIRTEAAYRDIWDAFRPSGGVRLLFACDASGEVVAVLLLVRCGSRVVEPYGGMTADGADLRANYLLKWEAIRTSRDAGATSYDMWGLVHPGIRQFKEGFGGREIRLIGAWDLPLRGVGWKAYRVVESSRRTAPRVTAATAAPVASRDDQ